jgi:hypothetical protein
VSQFVNAEGFLLSCKEFLSLYKVPVTPKDFSIALDAIPSGVALLFRNVSGPDPLSLPSVDPVDLSVGKSCFSFGPVKDLVSAVCCIPYVMHYWNGLIDNICWKKVSRYVCGNILLTKLRKFPLKLFINIILPTTI